MLAVNRLKPFYRPGHNTKGGPQEIRFCRSWKAKMEYTRR